MKRIVAEPSVTVDDKELVWLGKGSHVSYEVAQAMGQTLKSINVEEEGNIADIPGLFSRSRELLSLELEKDSRAVVLDNSIEVVRLANGSYQYRTFIGAMGNLILATAIRDYFAGKDEDITALPDEIGLICSEQVKFEKLLLPLTGDDFALWITRHFKMMAAMFPLNAFCTTLPRDLLCLELTGFIRDDRLLDFFNLCNSKTSAIVAGDPADLSLQAVTPTEVALEIPSQSEPLLDWEKKRRTNLSAPLFHPDGQFQPKAITGTIIGEYFRHQQCGRWLSLQFFQTQEQPLRQTVNNNDAISIQRCAKGLAFEEQVISHLQGNDKICKIIAAKDADSQKRTVADRFAETIRCFEQRSRQENKGSSYIAQPVLQVDSMLSLSPPMTLPGVGIPDLIHLRSNAKKDGVFLQVGDIKSSNQPRYYQKWQVAFYAWLLRQVVENKPYFTVADIGFILTPSGDEELAIRHVFDLKPYFASMQAVLENFKRILDVLPWQSFWQIQQHCISCPGFEWCYQQALHEEEIQFIPKVRRGMLQKMRTLGVTQFQQDIDLKNGFSIGQKQALQDSMTALLHNNIISKGKNNKTDLFPANISTLFVVHLVIEPVSGMAQNIGLVMHRKGKEPEIFSWDTDTDSAQDLLWTEFSSRLAQLWHDAIENRRGPHLLLFDQKTRKGLMNLAERQHDRQMKALFSSGDNRHYTELRQLLSCHFSLPLPGTMTLFGLNRVLALMPEIDLPKPETLLHEDRFAEIEIITVCELVYKLWQWGNSHLKSQWQKEGWHLPGSTDFDLSDACLQLIEAERSYQQRDIAALMDLTLPERVERFRALGPLDFTGTSLDEEGKFTYLFAPSEDDSNLREDNRRKIPAKFRAGDFLKLVPLGVADLQSGLPVIMAGFNSQTGEVALYPRRQGEGIFKGVKYSLEEDGEDYHSEKMRDVAQQAFTDENYQITELFGGTHTHHNWPVDHFATKAAPTEAGHIVGAALAEKNAANQEQNYDPWLQDWLNSEAAVANLNPSQQQALQLPFRHALSLISGPPGTGKTHLLGWILIALIRQAQHQGVPLRIAVGALTHKAIDQVLKKLVTLVNTHNLPDFPVRCLKLGRWEGEQFDLENPEMQVEPCATVDVLSSPYLILGATGYGLHTMLHKQAGSRGSQKPFDWIIFDEASQILIPHALLSLIHGKGNFLFLGDVCQLPPIIRSTQFNQELAEEKDSYVTQTQSSVLDVLLNLYPQQNQLLNTTYRMNDVICRFPSEIWYKGQLLPDSETAGKRLSLSAPVHHDLIDEIINPAKPMVLVGIDHPDWSEATIMEADLLANISHRLLREHDLHNEQIAIISPHRTQNNSITGTLAHLLGHDDLPVIDTVERMQGAERDVILFCFGCSDSDQIFSEFLNNPNRFNVVLTRARHKVIVVGNTRFFEAVASTEKQLNANRCFKEFFRYCQENNCYFWHPSY